MVIGLLQAQLSIPESRSLKNKRAVLRSLKDRVLNSINISVAEVGEQNEWQFAELAFVTVATDRDTVDKRLAAVTRMLEGDPRHVLTDIRVELL